MKSNPEYHFKSPEYTPFSRKVEVALLARTTSPLPIEDFSEGEWTALNSTVVIAGEAAKTCYSPNLLTPLDYLVKSDKHRQNVYDVAGSTRASGHHSTREHVHYIFGVRNLSRKAIYQLHSHPHHATDQESQRYVTMSEEGVILPRTGNQEADSLIEKATNNLFEGYHHLVDLLSPLAKSFYLKRFPGRNFGDWIGKVNDEAKKRAQEIARYLLPLSVGANLYHSINELTLVRLAKMTQADQTDPELYYFVKTMVDAVAVVDPSIRDEIGKPFDTCSTPDYQYYLHNQPDSYTAADEFDKNMSGLPVRLDRIANLDHLLAEAVRVTLGVSSTKLSDEAAIDLVLNPAKNPVLASVNGEMVIHQLSRALNQVNLSASVTLSHVIDSQLQRHRAINHTRPLYLPVPRLEQDIVVPGLVNYSQEALDLYLSLQLQNIRYMEQLAQMRNVSVNTLNYLNTNATRIRKRINGPLGAFHHLLRLRTCLNAQEENYNIARALVIQLPDVSPLIASHFDKPAPCGIRIRAGITPICPEGDHYCGIPVWGKTIADYPTRDI